MTAPDRIQITHRPRNMSTPTIRAALDTFQQAANRGTAVYLSPELVQELRDALKAEPEGEGPSVEQMYYWALKSIYKYGSDTLSEQADDRGWLRAAVAEMVRRAQESLDYGTPATPPAPEPETPPNDAWWHELINEIARVQHVAAGEGQGGRFDLAEAVELWCRPATPPALEPGEGPTLADVDELCAEFGFHYDNDQGETLEMLRDMIFASLTRWGPPSAASPAPQAGEVAA
jgi:hypothetical protein